MATPFVQGRLRNEYLKVEVRTECAHCGQEMHLSLDSELRWSIEEPGAQPLLFEPEVDWHSFTAPNIIHDY